MLKNNVKFKLIVAYKCRQTSFYCTLLYCTSQISCFLQIEGLWQPNIEQVCQYNFPSSICSFCVYRSVQFSSVTQPYLTLCDPKDHITPGFLVHHQPMEHTTHVHRVNDAIQSSHPLLSPFPPAFDLPSSGCFQKIISSYQVVKILELQLQHQSLQ